MDLAAQLDDVLGSVVVLRRALSQGARTEPDELLVERSDSQFGVGDDCTIGLVDLVDLGGGDIDGAQNLAGEQVRAEIEGGMLSEGVADRQDCVRFAEGFPRGLLTAVTKEAQAEGMVVADQALAVHSGDEGNLEAFEQGGQLRSGAASNRAEA